MTAEVAELLDADAVLERRIWRWRRRMETAADPEVQRHAFGQMKSLIEQRSPAQVERMERRRGLR